MADEKVISVRLRAVTDQFKASMDSASGAVKDFASDTDRIQQAGAKMKTAGRSMTVGVTLPIVAAGVAAVKTAVDFDTSMSRIQGLVGLSGDEVSTMRDRVLELSGSTTKSPQELAEALFAVTSAGLRGEQALGLLEDAGKASAAGLGDTKQIALTATAAMRAFGLSSGEAVDIMVAAVREGNLSAEEMAGAFGKIIQIGQAAGVTFQEIAGLTAFLTRGNVTASEATTQLESAILALNSPTQEAAASLEAAGGSVDELQSRLESGGIVGALEYLEEALDGDELAMRKALGSSEALAAAQSILADESGDLSSILDGVADSAGAGADAFDAYADSDGYDAAQAWAEIQKSLIEIGQQLIPVISQGADVVGTFVSAFAALPEAGQTAVIAFMGILAITGPLLNALGSLMVAFPQLGPAAIAMAGKVRAAMATMTSSHPVLAALTLAIGAAVAAWQIFGGESEGVSDDVRSLTEAMREQNDVVGENTRAWLQNKLAGDDAGGAAEQLLNLMRDAGLTVADLETALAAGGDAVTDFYYDLANGEGLSQDLIDVEQLLYELDGEFTDATARAELLDAVLGSTGETAAQSGEGMANAAEGASVLADAEQEAADAARDLESALAPLSVAMAKSEAAIAARDAVRSLGEAYTEAAAEGGIAADEMDNLRSETNSLVEALIRQAEANNTAADGTVNASAAQGELRASMAAVRAFIPAEMLPMFDRYTAHIKAVPREAPTTPRAPGINDRRQEFINLGGSVRSLPSGVTITAQANVESAIAAFNRLKGVISNAGAAAASAQASFHYATKSAKGGYFRARPGGHLANVAEAGYDEIVVSTDPKYQKEAFGLLADAGFLTGHMTPAQPAPAPVPVGAASGPSPAVLAAAVESGLRNVDVVLDGKKVGQLVTKRLRGADREVS